MIVKLNTFSSSGIKRGTTELPKDLVEEKNLYLLAQAVRVYEARLHKATSKVKTRGEVDASSAKIWRQKGTGRARHGDRGAPIFVKGGVAHGPKGLKRKLKLPKNLGKKARKGALLLKANQGELVVAENLKLLKKTKEAVKLLDSIIGKQLEGKRPSKITIALARENLGSSLAFRNIKNTRVLLFENLNAHLVFFGGLIVIDKDALKKEKSSAKAATQGAKSKPKSKAIHKTKTDKKRKLVKRKSLKSARK